MKTQLWLIGIVTILFAASGCEDDHVYPGPQTYPPSDRRENMVTIPIPFNPEFDAVIKKSVHLLTDQEVVYPYGEAIYWWGLGPDQPLYLLEMDGNGEAPYLGEFNFHLESVWASKDLCLSMVTITPGNFGSFNINLKSEAEDFTPEYPYDLMEFYRSFTVLCYNESAQSFPRGSGTTSFTVSETSPGIMKVKFDGTLDLVIR
jgi:hypothetical protein